MTALNRKRSRKHSPAFDKIAKAVVEARLICQSYFRMGWSCFDSSLFAYFYDYDGNDLGAVIKDDVTEFKVWSPTARNIILNLYEAGNDCGAYAHIEMEKGKNGVWSARSACGHGTYYTYSITDRGHTQETVDLYARAVGVNGDRGMVVDLSLTDPEGFRKSDYVRNITRYEEAVIWEVCVRDFSCALESSAFPGKYLAFTEEGLVNEDGIPVGVDYLKWLGITHVHLQPVCDFTDDRHNLDETDPDAEYSWGYITKNYFAPDGTYSTDPYHGEVRIRELKRMIQTLHENGIGVVLDMVYNHTERGLSIFQKTVQDYYYRFYIYGAPSNGSGIGNETESRRTMFRKFMMDNLRYWLVEYKVDGFRFDAMALHDMETMQMAERTIHAINPYALIYGEAWNAGPSALKRRERASLDNIRDIRASENAIGGIAVFDYCLRDGLMGHNLRLEAPGYALGASDEENARMVAFGIDGCRQEGAATYSVQDNMVIHYISCHDDYTVYDRLSYGHPERDMDWVLRTNRMAASSVMVSRGVPFMLAGEEMLRTKKGERNSVHSSPELNSLKWNTLTKGSPAYTMACFYRELIAMRRKNAFFTTGDVATEIRGDLSIEVKWYTEERNLCGYALLNPNNEISECECPCGEWEILLKDGKTYDGCGEKVHGSVTVSPQSVLILRKTFMGLHP